MLILGVETSCDETAAALIEVADQRRQDADSRRILSNIISSQIKIHQKYRGIVPEVAARAHFEKILPVIKEAIAEIKNLEKIDLIAVTHGPGLITSLLVGLEAAKTLSYLFKKPLIPVNHLEGHIYANWLSSSITDSQLSQNKIFPAVCLIVSGGHTELLLMKDYGRYQRLGGTRDDAAGECFDKVARLLNLGYPGGPVIEDCASKFKNSLFKINLPRPMINQKNFDFSFSGLKTAVLYKMKASLKDPVPREFIKSLAAETQESIVDVLIFKTIKVAKRFSAKSVILSGGVAANQRLRDRMKEEAEKIGKIFLVPPKNFCTDNAAMIAMAGYFNYRLLNPKQKNKLLHNWQKIEADPNLML